MASSLELPPQIAYDPERSMRMLDALDAESSLRDYTRLVWSILEPGRPLVYGWHMEAIGEHLEAISRGELKRLLINVPPGFSKSLQTNVLWPSWEWGPRNQAFLRYVSFAYSSILTVRDNRRCRNLIRSELYQRLWGHRFQIVSDQDAKVRYDTDQSGFRLATSVGGTGTGERGDRIVIDDPNNVRESESSRITDSTLQWFAEVIPSRTTDIRTSAIVLIQQRTGVNDCTGHALRSELGYEWLCLPMEYERTNPCYTPLRRRGVKAEKVRLVKLEEETVPRWMKAKQPAGGLVATEGPVRTLTRQDRRSKEGELLDPERFPRAEVEADLKKPLMSRGGHAAVAGQLQQRPQPREGSMFKRENFRFCEPHEVPARVLAVAVRGYDLAASTKSTSPYTAGVKMGQDFIEDVLYVLDVERVRKEPGPVMLWHRGVCESDGPVVHHDFPQDPGSAGKAQKVFFGGKLSGFKLYFSTEQGTKPERAIPFASQVEIGNVVLVRGPWNDAFIAEAVTFPGGDYKDQIDAASRAYARALKRARMPAPSEGPKIITG